MWDCVKLIAGCFQVNVGMCKALSGMITGRTRGRRKEIAGFGFFWHNF